ncbi:MAG: hypothetical protein AAGF77_06880 [Bacteroidota bacterium]
MMIAIFKWSVLIIPLCASLCGCPEDENVPPISYETSVPNLVFVDDDRQAYGVGDTLWLNMVVPDEIILDTGTTESIYNLTEEDHTQIYFRLTKASEFEEPLLVTLAENEFVTTRGELIPREDRPGILIATLTRNSDAYGLRVGLLMKSTGDFNLSPDFVDVGWAFYFYDQDYSVQPLKDVVIASSFRNAEAGLTFKFTVQ